MESEYGGLLKIEHEPSLKIEPFMNDPDKWRMAAETVHQIAIQAREAIENLAHIFGLVFNGFTMHTVRENLTPRQYHLYVHGKRRVSKKWENAAWRNARLKERRKIHV